MNTKDEKIKSIYFWFSNKRKKMVKFSDGPSPGHDTADFDVANCFLLFYTFITNDELPTALNICGKNIF